jgi:hypothetical protein
MGEEKKNEFEVVFHSENGKLKVETVSENFTVEEFMKQRHIIKGKARKKEFKALDKHFRKEFIKKSKSGELDLGKIFPDLKEIKKDSFVNYELKSGVTIDETKDLKEKLKKFLE